MSTLQHRRGEEKLRAQRDARYRTNTAFAFTQLRHLLLTVVLGVVGLKAGGAHVDVIALLRSLAATA